MKRHRWSAPSRSEHETSRACLHCGLLKITRHEPNAYPWTEFWRDDLKVETDCTPPCITEAERSWPPLLDMVA